MYDEDECRKDDRCEMGRNHQGPCARWFQHDSMCGCGTCASKFENGGFQPTFEKRELNNGR